jgi:hydroxymethylglutaryl-CoA lyase
MTLPAKIRIVEVSPRDGLQNEAAAVTVETKLALIAALADAGAATIEAGSFVSSKWVPQMAGTDELFQRLPHRPGVTYQALIPNLQGLERALAAGATEVAVFAAASETFSQKNTNGSIAEILERFAPVLERARAENIPVRSYVSCALGCPYEGPIAPEAVARLAAKLTEMGCYEISLGDTIGVGTPAKAHQMVETVAADVPVSQLALHFHDTYGQALANIHACLDLGVTVIDSAVAGLGGCPYAKGASGNVATEDVVYMLEGMGIETGLDIHKLAAAGALISKALGRPTGSRAARALGA